MAQPLAGHLGLLRIVTCSHLAEDQLFVPPSMGTSQRLCFHCGGDILPHQAEHVVPCVYCAAPLHHNCVPSCVEGTPVSASPILWASAWALDTPECGPPLQRLRGGWHVLRQDSKGVEGDAAARDGSLPEGVEGDAAKVGG